MAYSSRKKAEAEEAAASLQLLREKLKSGELSGVYLFRGEEEYLKRYYFGELKKAAGNSGAKVTEFYGGDFQYTEFADAVYTAPDIDYTGSFFEEEAAPAGLRVVRAFDPKLSGLSSREEEELLSLCQHTPEGVAAVFYFSYSGKPEEEKKFDKGFLKKLRQKALEVNFRHEAPGSVKLRKWVQKHVSSAGCFMDDRTADYFLSSVGNDMSTLFFEGQKLCAYLALRENKTVSYEDIDRVCIRTGEAKLEEVSDAAFRGDFGKAQAALTQLLRERTPEPYILGALASRVSQLYGVACYRGEGLSTGEIATKLCLWESKVRSAAATLSALNDTARPRLLPDMAQLVAEYDMKIKSSSCDKGLLLSDLLFRLCLLCRKSG